MKLRLHPEAEAEVEAAARWYEERAALGDDFMIEVDRAFRTISRSPLTWPRPWPQEPSLRRFVLARFPFTLVYAVRGRELVVYAVAPTRRDPTYWRHRLKVAPGRRP